MEAWPTTLRSLVFCIQTDFQMDVEVDVISSFVYHLIVSSHRVLIVFYRDLHASLQHIPIVGYDGKIIHLDEDLLV